jgi:hypothetical protein
MSVILALEKLRQKDHDFKASLDYIVRPCCEHLKQTNQPKPIITFSIIYPNELKTCPQRNLQLLTATPLLMVKILKQSKCPSAGEKINKTTVYTDKR